MSNVPTPFTGRTPGFTPQPIVMILTDLSSTVIMDTSGTLLHETLSITGDVVANFYTTVTDMSNVFQFETESEVIGGVNDPSMNFFVHLFDSSANHQDNTQFSGADCYWTTDPQGLPLLRNPGNAIVTSIINSDTGFRDANGPYTMNNVNVVSEYDRYLALKLFNTSYGTELFTNIHAMNASLNNVLIAGSGNVVLNSLLSVATTRNSQSVAELVRYDFSANGVMNTVLGLPSSYTSADNLTRELMRQMETQQPDRFAYTQHTISPQGLPFFAGDSIEYSVIIKACPGQEQLTGVVPIPDRTYTIKINIMADRTYINSINPSLTQGQSLNIIPNTIGAVAPGTWDAIGSVVLNVAGTSPIGIVGSTMVNGFYEVVDSVSNGLVIGYISPTLIVVNATSIFPVYNDTMSHNRIGFMSNIVLPGDLSIYDLVDGQTVIGAVSSFQIGGSYHAYNLASELMGTVENTPDAVGTPYAGKYQVLSSSIPAVLIGYASAAVFTPPAISSAAVVTPGSMPIYDIATGLTVIGNVSPQQVGGFYRAINAGLTIGYVSATPDVNGNYSVTNHINRVIGFTGAVVNSGGLSIYDVVTGTQIIGTVRSLSFAGVYRAYSTAGLLGATVRIGTVAAVVESSGSYVGMYAVSNMATPSVVIGYASAASFIRPTPSAAVDIAPAGMEMSGVGTVSAQQIAGSYRVSSPSNGPTIGVISSTPNAFGRYVAYNFANVEIGFITVANPGNLSIYDVVDGFTVIGNTFYRKVAVSGALETFYRAFNLSNVRIGTVALTVDASGPYAGMYMVSSLATTPVVIGYASTARFTPPAVSTATVVAPGNLTVTSSGAAFPRPITVSSHMIDNSYRAIDSLGVTVGVVSSTAVTGQYAVTDFTNTSIGYAASVAPGNYSVYDVVDGQAVIGTVDYAPVSGVLSAYNSSSVLIGTVALSADSAGTPYAGMYAVSNLASPSVVIGYASTAVFTPPAVSSAASVAPGNLIVTYTSGSRTASTVSANMIDGGYRAIQTSGALTQGVVSSSPDANGRYQVYDFTNTNIGYAVIAAPGSFAVYDSTNVTLRVATVLYYSVAGVYTAYTSAGAVFGTVASAADTTGDHAGMYHVSNAGVLVGYTRGI